MNRKIRARRTGQPASFRGKDNHCVATTSSVGCLHFSFNSRKKASPVFTASDAPLRANQKPCSLDDWIGLIREPCSRGASSTLELARLMSKARRNLPYGRWSQLWQSGGLPFSKRKGEMLLVIGQCVEELDAQHSAHLPAAWNTLYYLVPLGRKTVIQLIKQGRIHPGLSLRVARALLAEYQPGAQRKSSRSKLRDRLARFAAFVRADMGIWSWAEQEFVSRQLRILAEEIHGIARFTSANPQSFVGFADQPDSVIQPLGEPFICISKL